MLSLSLIHFQRGLESQAQTTDSQRMRQESRAWAADPTVVSKGQAGAQKLKEVFSSQLRTITSLESEPGSCRKVSSPGTNLALDSVAANESNNRPQLDLGNAS